MKAVLITFVILLLGNWTYAQSLNLSFNHLNREGGLSNNNAFTFMTDSKSFLWIGTFNGLNRFDGSTCRVYKPFNSSIKGLSISNITEDQNNDLWFSSESGLNHYFRLTDSFENIDCIKDGKKRQHHPFYVDDKNRIWLSVIGEGIFVFNPKDKSSKKITNQVSNYAKVNMLPFQKVKQILYTNSQIGLNLLTIMNDKVVSSTIFFDGKKQPPIDFDRYFFIENDSLVWLTNHDHGLIKLNYRTQTFKAYQSNYFPKDHLTTVAFRPNYSQLFVGSNKHGILVFDTKQAKFIQQIQHSPANPKSLKSNWVEDIMVDRNQNLFVNILGWGIDFTNLNTSNTQQWLSKEEINKYKIEENVVNYSFVNKHKIYVHTQNGKSLTIDTDGKILPQNPRITETDKIFRSSDNILYACGIGMVQILNDDFTIKHRISLKNKPENNDQIYSISEITSDEFILGGNKSFYSLKKKGDKYEISPIEELNKPEFIVNQPIYFNKQSQQLFFSSIWWTEFHIAKKEKDKWIVKPIKKLEANIFNIVPDVIDSHKIWLCSNKGLLKFDTKTYQYDVWDESKGLPDNSVTTILPETNGDFWLITNRGISFYNKKSNVFKNYSEKDGAISSEYDWYGSFYLPDKRMMFGGTDGITVIDPKQFNLNTSPKLYITDLKANEKSIVASNYIGESLSINLKPYESSFSLEFVAIDYAKPESVNLQYQLQGVENKWITTKNPAKIHFSNVPEGNYYFKIRTLSDNGKITAEKSLKVIIAAPFWRTWWFRSLMLVVFVGIAYGFYRYRINELLKLQAVRNRISTDLHDEIGATLSGIGILSTIAKKQVDKTHPAYSLLGRITDDALTVGNAIDDIVWSINPKNDDLSNIIARLRRYASELFDAKNINYQIVTPENMDDVKMTMEQRRDVYLIFKEAINNLLKYAECTQVNININIENRKFNLVIADNGKGFDSTKSSSRNGIKNMKTRAENLKGRFTLYSIQGHGTKVDLEFLI